MKNLFAPAFAMTCFVLAMIAFAPAPQAQAEKPIVQTIVKSPPATGPGFLIKPKAAACDCDCEALEKRVAALEAKLATYGSARTVAGNGSAGNSAGTPAASTTRVVSRSYASPPAVTRQPARTVVRGVVRGTCRIVNGVRVCQ